MSDISEHVKIKDVLTELEERRAFYADKVANETVKLREGQPNELFDQYSILENIDFEIVKVKRWGDLIVRKYGLDSGR